MSTPATDPGTGDLSAAVSPDHRPGHPARNLHAVPCGDTVRHEAAADCVCVPQADEWAVRHKDGSLCGWIAVHSRLAPTAPGSHYHLTETP